MARKTATAFRSRELQQLTRQLLFAPPQRRLEQVKAAEALHDQIDADRTYPLDYLSYRITGRRSATDPDDSPLLVGEAVLPDLRQMIDTLSRSIDIPQNGLGEPSETVASLAARLDVSTKTVRRWRNAGLRWRWVLPTQGGRKCIVFPESSIQRFLQVQQARVKRATDFSQLSSEQRQQILSRARRIAEATDVSLNRVAVHLANKYGRAVETVRQILEDHDRNQPLDPIFIDRTGPLSARQKRVIVRAYRMNVSVKKIARHFGRTRSTIYRALNEHRAAEIHSLNLRGFTLPTFKRPDADSVFLTDPLSPDRSATSALRARLSHSDTTAPHRPHHVPLEDLPESLRPAYSSEVLTETEEHRLLVRLNYLKFKIDHLRSQLDRYEPRAAALDRIEPLVKLLDDTRQEIILGTLPMVLSASRRHIAPDTPADRVQSRLLDLLALGHNVLVESIDSFDLTRNQSFWSYLHWSLMRVYAADVANRGSVDLLDHELVVRGRARKRETIDTQVKKLAKRHSETGVFPAIDLDELEDENETAR